MKHWGEYLPEAGRPVQMRASDLQVKRERIKDLHRLVTQLEEEYTRDEEAFELWVLNDWTSEEVAEAQQEANAHSEQSASH